MLESFIKTSITMTGTTMTCWGAAIHNPVMVESGLVLLFLSVGVVTLFDGGLRKK